MENFKLSVDVIPLTDKIFEQLGFIIERKYNTLFTLEHSSKGHFTVDDSLGYRWTGDSLKGWGHNMTTLGDLKFKYFSVMNEHLDISGIRNLSVYNR